MNYAIMRVEKAKTLASVGSRAAHNLRTSPLAAPHANPSLRDANKVLLGTRTVAEVVVEVKKRLDAVAPFRKDAVLAVELVLSASPEFFAADGKRAMANRDAWQERSMQWLRETWGEDNIVLAMLHLDEETPHIQALVVPRHEGRLRAAYWLDGPAKMGKLQDSYANRLADLRLRRGQRGSKAEHVRLREFYRLTKRLAATVERISKSHSPPRLPERGRFGRVSDADWAKLQANLAKYHADGLALRTGAAAAALILSSKVGIEAARRTEMANDRAAEATACLAKLQVDIAASRAELVALGQVKATMRAEIENLDVGIAARTQILKLGRLEQHRDSLLAEIGDLQSQRRDLDRG